MIIDYSSCMSLYIIQSTGELTECENKDVALVSENVLLVISHNQKKIFTWIGSQSSPHSKFACARETARIRMELGYKIVNLEEDYTSDDFLLAVDEACKIIPSKTPKAAPAPPKKEEPVEEKPEPKPKPKTEPKPKETTKTEPKKTEPKPTTKKTTTKPKPKDEKETKTETKPKQKSTAVKTKVIDFEHILQQLEILQPMQGSIRDYIVIGDTLYIAPENLDETGTESQVNLPDGSFVADDYIPRLFLENGKIIAIELWRES
jgi:hypothetical protein